MAGATRGGHVARLHGEHLRCLELSEHREGLARDLENLRPLTTASERQDDGLTTAEWRMHGGPAGTFASVGRMLHAVAMFFAVPTLSPVSIQILIPAVRRSDRISGTPSCSLSSIAVAPCSVRSHSTSSCKLSIALGSPALIFATSSGEFFAW